MKTIESDYIFKGQQNIPFPFLEPITTTLISKRPVDILLAEYKINELLSKTGEASLYDFFKYLNLDMDEKLSNDANNFGWNIDCNCICGCMDGIWINFWYEPYIYLNDGCFKINMHPLPCLNYLNCMDAGCVD